MLNIQAQINFEEYIRFQNEYCTTKRVRVGNPNLGSEEGHRDIRENVMLR